MYCSLASMIVGGGAHSDVVSGSLFRDGATTEKQRRADDTAATLVRMLKDQVAPGVVANVLSILCDEPWTPAAAAVRQASNEEAKSEVRRGVRAYKLFSG